MNYWLVKQEPATYSWDDFVKEGSTDWTGVRNFQARNFLKEMKKDDQVLFYHSGEDKAVVGIATVVKPNFPDPTGDDPKWVAVHLKPVEPLKNKVTLADIKAVENLKDIHLVRASRLSVMPLPEAAYKTILKMSK